MSNPPRINIDPSQLPVELPRIRSNKATGNVDVASPSLILAEPEISSGRSPAERDKQRVPAQASVKAREATTKADSREKSAGFFGRILNDWQTLTPGIKMPFIALGASVIFIAIGQCLIGMTIGALGGMSLMKLVAKAVANASELQNDLNKAKEECDEAKKVIGDQNQQIKQFQKDQEAIRQRAEEAGIELDRAQQANIAMQKQVRDYEEAFTRVGSQAKDMAEELEAYVREAQTSIQVVIEETKSNMDQALRSLNEANIDIQAQIDGVSGRLTEEFKDIKDLAERQKKILEEGLLAYNTSSKPAQEKLEDLFVTIREAVKISNQISQKSNALYNTTKTIVNEIKNVVNAHIQKLTQDLTRGREEVAEKVVVLTQLAGRQKLIESKIENLRAEIEKTSSPDKRSELEILLEKQRENLALVSGKILDIRSAGERLGEDLERLIDNNSKLAEIAERFDNCLEEANSHTQAVAAAASKINLPGIVGAALGAGGAVMLGAGAAMAAGAAAVGAAGLGGLVGLLRWLF